jgi:DNA-directed RNA polymerase subunit RPC12/RpoP
MSDLLDYKCPACGGALEFDTASQKMLCPYCGSQYEMSQLQQKDTVLNTQQPDMGAAPASQQGDQFNWDGTAGQDWNGEDANMSVFVCKSCGGEIVGDANTAATACPYCGNPVVMSGRLSGMLKPDFVIPFKLDKKAAKEKLKSYVASKKFAPNSFKSENKLEEIKGIYVPYWLFDSNINAAVSYEGTRVRTWSDRNYEYTETSYFDIYRQGNMSFANIPVDGSSKMPDDLMESIEPFNFAEAVNFQTAYLAGYLADKYDVDRDASIPRANERIKSSAESTLKDTVQGFATVTPKYSSVQLMNGVSKYALYPVWLLNTDYKGTKYTFAMNGQTGKFIGNLPVDKGKLTRLFLGVAAGVTAAVYVVGSLLLGLF